MDIVTWHTIKIQYLNNNTNGKLHQTEKTKAENEGKNTQTKKNKIIIIIERRSQSCPILTIMHWPWLIYLEKLIAQSFGF